MAVIAVRRARADFFNFNLQYMRWVGLWPDEEWSWHQKFMYKVYQVFLLLLAAVYLTVTGIGMHASRHCTLNFLENVDKAIVSYNFILKVIMFLNNRDHVKVLILNILSSGDEIKRERKKLMAIHTAAVTGLSTAIIGGFQLMHQIKGDMAVDAWLPFDYSKNSFTVFLAGQVMGVLFVVPVVYRAIAIQGIVCSIVMYICDQLVELQVRLKAIAYTVENDKAIRKEFKDIIKKHIRMMEYAVSLRSVFKEYFLVQNLAITAELCLNALMMSLIGMEQKNLLITFMAFLIVALSNAYIFCYLGQELMDQSSGIANAAYEAPWTSWPLDMQKDLLIIINAAQNDLSLSAGGMAKMSMETFALALYNGYSLFAVLRDMVH